MILKFLDYIEKIIDSFPDYEKRLYSIIGKFSTIKYGKFASRSLSCIKQRISGENSKEIVEVLSEVHTFLKRETEENIPVNVIDSLQLFLDEPIFVNPMKTLLKRIMTIGQKIDNDINYNANSTNNIDALTRFYTLMIRDFTLSIDEFKANKDRDNLKTKINELKAKYFSKLQPSSKDKLSERINNDITKSNSKDEQLVLNTILKLL